MDIGVIERVEVVSSKFPESLFVGGGVALVLNELFMEIPFGQPPAVFNAVEIWAVPRPVFQNFEAVVTDERFHLLAFERWCSILDNDGFDPLAFWFAFVELFDASIGFLGGEFSRFESLPTFPANSDCIFREIS